MTRITRRLASVFFIGVVASACGLSENDGEPRAKNSAVTTTTLTTPIGPDQTLTAPEGVLFGSRVAIDRAMVFASTRARPNETKGVVYASSFADSWSAPREVVGSWDFHFGRDIDVNNHDVIATAADTRSGLFGNRTGEILVGPSPRSDIVNTSPRLGLYARSGDDLGAAVALSDNYMAVSAPSVGRWTTPTPIVIVTSLTNASSGVTSVGPGDIPTGETFGTALDMDDSTLVVGASGALGGDGALFVYTRSGDSWNLTQRLDGTNDEAFGSDVALVGSRMVVGAPGSAQGAVHVCERSSGTWTCPTRIAHPDTSATGLRAFGAAVDLATSADEFIVGAPWAIGMTCCPGEAFTYALRDGAWSLSRSLQPTSPANDDNFGNSVGIDDGVAVVGAPRAARGAGTVSIFGNPTASARAPRAAVSFTSPVVGGSVAASITFSGGAPGSYAGSLQAWDRNGNSWRSNFDVTTLAFGGNWPDANSAYGSLTVANQYGYETASLTANISAPTPTTLPTTTLPTTTLPNTTSPSIPRTTLIPGSVTPTTVTTSESSSTNAQRPAPGATSASGQLALSSDSSAPQSPRPTTTKPTPGVNSPPTVSGVTPVTTLSPFAISLAATCRTGQPCTVEVPVLLGGKTGSMRGAPPGLRYNPRTATISGVPRKRGAFTITIKAAANGKMGSATVSLTVK